ncbi:General transcription and DNA repair factor IIH [Abortiporus biennis]
MPPRRINDTYMDVDSDSDISIHGDDQNSRSKPKGKGKAVDRGKAAKNKGKAKEQPYAWEATYTRSWDTVQEDESGSLQGAVEDLIARGRRRRLLAPASAIRRTIIRHLVLILDLSSAMMDRDMRPTRFDLMLQYAREFITEWFDQNPLGQIGVVGMRSGLGERIGEMSGNPQDVLRCISERHKLEPSGEPSLQNAVEMARSSMAHLPIHSSREILIIFGSLTTCDPGNIHDTLDECVKDKIRISIIALAAEMKICRDMCDKTGGQFGVAMNEGHFKDLLFELIPPPAQRAVARAGGAGTTNPAADLMMMGFPTRLPNTSPPSLCQKFATFQRIVIFVPYQAVSTLEGSVNPSANCHGCGTPFKDAPVATGSGSGGANHTEGMSPYGRYRCPDCSNDFCTECDVFVHDVVHSCPGCGK